MVVNAHIRNLDDEIDNFKRPEEKNAVLMIRDIPGIADTGAQAIISVIGTDMNRFPTDSHISAWAGLCPGDHESAKKRAYVAVARSMLIAIYHILKDAQNTRSSVRNTTISSIRNVKLTHT